MSQWSGGANQTRYELDDSGRLVREVRNRFVVEGAESMAAGELKYTGRGSDHRLRLVSRDDDLSASFLDLQRWELAISEPSWAAVQMRPEGGLHWTTTTGRTQQFGRTLPAGWPRTGEQSYYDDNYFPSAPNDYVGWFNGTMVMRHRLPLEGEFDVQISLSEMHLSTYASYIGLGLTRARFSTDPGGNQYPSSNGGTIDPNGCDLVLTNTSGLLAKFNNYALTPTTPQKLRLRRFLDGSDWKLQAYYWDGSSWQTHANWVDDFSDQTLFAYVHLSGFLGRLRWSDFVETEGTPYLLSSVDGDESVNQANWPSYESQTYDAGFSTDFTRISWEETLPSNTDVRFQVAVSNNPEGPWTYAGPSGANSYYSTPAGQTLTDLTGRYCKFRAFLYSTDGLDTPEFWNVHITHDGTSGSSVTDWTYDDAGNITQIDVITDAGTATETRTVNDLNQILTQTKDGDTWSFVYDDNGCLIVKTNGAALGDERWEFTWDADDRLIQVKKGVYTSSGSPAARYHVTDYGESSYGFGSGLVNEFTVDYDYDQAGRMLRRDDGENVTTMTWDKFDCLSETTDSVTTDYLVPRGLIWSFVRGGDLFVAHCDALGSVRMVTNSEGEVVAQLEYSPWGEILNGSFDSVPGGISSGFVGALGVRTDAATGLLYMRNRWYSCQTKRFISRDPIGLSAGANVYAYCDSDNPMNCVDPMGLKPWPWWLPTRMPAMSGGLGGFASAADSVTLGGTVEGAALRSSATRGLSPLGPFGAIIGLRLALEPFRPPGMPCDCEGDPNAWKLEVAAAENQYREWERLNRLAL